jgi:hypothetical protein
MMYDDCWGLPEAAANIDHDRTLSGRDSVCGDCSVVFLSFGLLHLSRQRTTYPHIESGRSCIYSLVLGYRKLRVLLTSVGHTLYQVA